MSKDFHLSDRIYAYKVVVEDADKVHVQIFQGTLKAIGYEGSAIYVYAVKTNSGDIVRFTEKSHMFKLKKNLLRALKKDLKKRTLELYLKAVRLQEAFFDGMEKAKELL